MDDGLIRQRRNLMITCCVLWLLCFAGAKEPPHLAIGAWSIRTSRPEAVYVAVWLAFGYFLFRYCIYALAKQDELKTLIRTQLGRAGLPVLTGLIKDRLNCRHVDTVDLPDGFALLRAGQELEVKASTSDPKTGWQEAQVLIPVTSEVKWKVRRRMFGVAFRLLIADKMTSDYLFPLVLSLFVLWYAGRGEWSGSLANLLLS